MRTRRTTIVAALVAALALAATGSLAGGAAPAQAYYLTSTAEVPDGHLNVLRFPPRNPGFRPCIARTVTLPRGTYEHGAYIVSEGHRTKPDLENSPRQLVVRRRTTFNWRACRGWNTDAHNNGLGFARYQVRSSLERPGTKSHEVLMTFENDSRTFIYGNGDYEWGGRIAQACNDCT
jgi:hypothetical protein